MAADDPSLLRVLISTDNHLGVWEKDEVRRDDSFRAFEEVLQLAQQLKVDFVLLGGDLFHENKPSRATVVRAISILSKYCLNDSSIKFQILSDQRTNFVSGRVNYEDPNLNVGLPIFTIHGNHDDPGGADNLSAVDILSSCSLINYFGKVLLTGTTGTGSIMLSPILLEKASTKLALYGLGNIRDERLGRAFQTPGSVQWQRPAGSPGYPPEDWLNVFVLHQNRVQHGAFAKACVQEQHLPKFLDLVVWGHEHECRPNPELVRGGGDDGNKRYILQPGSTVATALSEGESKRKHAVLLEVLGEQYRTVLYPLMTVRPFVFDNVVLRENPSIKPEDQEAIGRFLKNKVEAMMRKAAAEQPPPDGQEPLLPLIRLRVDYTGFSTVNAQRFGQQFVGKVANPQDMLLWTKAAAKKVKAEAGLDPSLDEGFLRPEALDQSRIEDLISQHLAAGGGTLEVLPHEELALALHNYVEKDDKNAITQCVEAALLETQRAALEGHAAAPLSVEDDPSLIVSMVRAGADRRRTTREAEGAKKDGYVDVTSLGAGATAPAGAAATGRYRAGGADAIEDDGEGDTPAGPLHGAPSTQGRGRGRGRGATAAAASSGAAGSRQQNILDAFGRGRGAAAPTPTGKGRGRGGKAAGGTTREAAGRGRGRGKAAAEDMDVDDAIEDSDDDEDEQPASTRRAASTRKAAAGTSTRQAPARRKAAAGPKKYKVQSDDEAALDDEDSDGYGARNAAADARASDDDDAMEEDHIEDSPPPQPSGRGRSQASKPKAGGARGAAAGGSKGAGPSKGAAAHKIVTDSITITDSDDDMAPPTGRAGLGTLGTLMTTQGTVLGATQQGTGGATQQGTNATAAAGAGGRKRPASFLTSSSTQRTGGAAGLKGWGQAR